MAACDLVFELDDRKKVYVDGEPVSGKLIVHAHKDIKCKGLNISTGWRTHGRGNVDTGKADSTEVFSGNWQAGQVYEYTFSLKTGGWPPSYFGTLLNVSHAVNAQAKISWAFDPRSSIEIPVVCTRSQAEVEQEKPKGKTPVWLWILGAVFVALFGFMFLFLIPILLLIGGISWFFMSFLPKSITGRVEASVNPMSTGAGQVLKGNIKFTPKRSSAINGVTAKLTCQEVCVSGSGSNRRTHRHEVFCQTKHLIESERLVAGKLYNLDFKLEVPPNAPPSLDLSDNDLIWNVEVRVDIPRWPDFKQDFKILVLPQKQVDGLVEQVEDSEPTGDEWFEEVLKQMHVSADDPERLEMVVEAISKHQFDVSLNLSGSTMRPPEADHVHGGRWLSASDSRSREKYLLHYDDHKMELKPNSEFQGKIRLIGFRKNTSEVIAQALQRVGTPQ